jgi:Acyclic terpene utilisation family protein AtuA
MELGGFENARCHVTAPVRIGCGSGFWGDTAGGPAQLVRQGKIDFLVLDYLAEITMSILSRARQKKPELGYATDFVDAMMAPLAREIAEKKIRVIANAGGVNPRGCGEALTRMLQKLGVNLKVAVVCGDDVLPQIPGLRAASAKNLETDGPIPEALISANAYLGAKPIAEALKLGADVVITGRCVDSALALGPLLAAFGWRMDDWNKLAMGSLAGHVIECGAQATGGIFTDWHLVEAGWSNMGFPIVICEEDGSFVVTKPEGTGGLISPATVSEQIVYEVHDPAHYVLADVVCDFSDAQLEQVGEDQVRVSGARGFPATLDYKASLTYQDGFRVGGTLLIVGDEAVQKAQRVGEAILQRAEMFLKTLKFKPFRETSIEVLGSEQSFGKNARTQNSREVVLKIAAAHDEERALEIFAREIAPAGTSMAQSISGFAGGRARVQPIVKLASCLVPKDDVHVTVEIGGSSHAIANEKKITDPASAPATRRMISMTMPSALGGDLREVSLRFLAHGRSGDKGNTSNIGIIARDPKYLAVIRQQVTPEAVAEWFAHLVHGKIRCFEWPGLCALNFVMSDALGGGGVASLRYDPQGKGLAQNLLEMPVRVPAAWLDDDAKKI